MDCMGYLVYTEPTTEPVSASEMLSYLNISSSDTSHNTVLEAMITAARQQIERVTGRIFCTTTHDVQYRYFPSDMLALPLRPVQSITSIKYKVSGVLTTLSSSAYELQSYKFFPEIWPAYGYTWPSADENSVIVRILTGFTTSPYDAHGKQILKAIVADMFEHREVSSEISLSANASYDRIMGAYSTR